MIRGPEVAVGVPKAERPEFCGNKHGVPAMPQVAAEVAAVEAAYAYWVVRTPVTLVWLSELKASEITCNFTRSLSDTFRVTRGSKEIVAGR